MIESIAWILRRTHETMESDELEMCGWESKYILNQVIMDLFVNNDD